MENGNKQNNGHFISGVLSMTLLSFVRGSVGFMRLGACQDFYIVDIYGGELLHLLADERNSVSIIYS